MNLYEIFLRTVGQQPEHMACIDLRTNDHCSYRRLLELVDSAAQMLDEAGTRPGMCIGLHLTGGREYIVWAYAIWKCGATVVPIAVELVSEEKAEICRTVRISGVITTSRDASVFSAFKARPEAILGGHLVFIPMTEACDHPSGFSEVNAAFIRFTSGTTANSKGVVLSHETVYARLLCRERGP